jgi:hypothetical protein
MSYWGECPKCIDKLKINYLEMFILPYNILKIRAIKRIGPHNIDILSIIFGSLLGDSYAEKHGNGTRICFQQERSHNTYLL